MSPHAAKRRLLPRLVAVAALALASAAAGQEDLGALLGSAGSSDDGGVPDCVEVRAYLDRDAYHAGEEARVALEMRVNPAVHVNGNEPPEEWQVATSLTWDELPPGVKPSSITWPKPKMQAFEFTEGKKIPVFEGTQRAYFTVKVPAGASGSLKLVGTFRAQGCTHQTCFAPQTDPVKVTLRVVPADEETSAVNEEKFAAPKKAEGDAHAGEDVTVASASSGEPPAGAAGDQATPPAASEETSHAASLATSGGAAASAVDGEKDLDCAVAAQKGFEGKPLLLVYVFALLTGLGLTLTPCVLPLVPITIGYFSRQRTDGGRPLGMATLYVLGLATVYSALGTVAALSGSLFGALLQNPWVLSGMAAILLALALSMFGILPDLQVPSALSSRIGGARTGKAGAALMGGAMGVVAAPCVGPGVVSLLTYVAKLGSEMPTPQAALVGGSLFFVLSLGLGTPFFLVGMGVASIKTGAWMVTVKKVFGFMILGVALWLVRPLTGDTVFGVALALLLVAACVYLLVHAPGITAPGLRMATRVVAAAAAVASLVTVLVLTGNMPFSGGGGGREFLPYSDAHVETARSHGKPVVIDFGAEWCGACKEIEHRVFPDPTVQELFEDFVLLRADMTQEKDPAVKALGERYRVRGLPTIIFLDAKGREVEDLRLTGFEPPEDFAERLRCVTTLQVAGT